MPARRRVIELGSARGRASVAMVARELELAIREHGLTYAAVGRDIGLSGTQVGRVIHGKAPDLTIMQASELLAAVGQELSIRAYPVGEPLRDRAHLALLERLRQRLHGSLGWRTEVPVSGAGDLRAWDAQILGANWTDGVEAETRLFDSQAIQRRILLKQRDGSVAHVFLLLADTRHNRNAFRAAGAGFAEAFPMPGRRVLELLAAGAQPSANGVILL